MGGCCGGEGSGSAPGARQQPVAPPPPARPPAPAGQTWKASDRCPVPTWYIPLCPAPPGDCPTTPCPNENPAEQAVRYKPKNSWWAKKKPEDNLVSHDACWCNGWKMGTKTCLPPVTEAVRPPRCRKNAVVRTGKQLQRYEQERRKVMFPPPPPDICSYKPCVMNMNPPSECDPTWSGVPQKCAKEPKSTLYVPEVPCPRPGCLHKGESGIDDCKCLYDCPCLAACFKADAYTRAWRYPRGYPHVG